MFGAVATASFVMASLGAFYLLTADTFSKPHLRSPGVCVGMRCFHPSVVSDGRHAGKERRKMATDHARGYGGSVETAKGAPLAIVGQPDTERRRLDNPLHIRRC